MKRIDASTVVLTPTERHLQLTFSNMLDNGLGIKDAVDKLLETHRARMSKQFVKYLLSS